MDLEVPVLLNRAVVEHDVALVLGPVLPHEVVGISGGNKYFFPGVAGQEIIDVSHWLGALITSAEIIGTTGHHPGPRPDRRRRRAHPGGEAGPVRRHRRGRGRRGGRAWTPRAPPVAQRLHSVSFGDTIASWAAAAEVCAATHVTYLDAPVRRVLSIIPEMYDDIWTGAKGFYKLEPVVADGGEVILYAPHITRDLLDAPGDRRDRLPLPRLLREAVGPVLAHPLGRARPLDAPARRRHLRRGDRRGAAAGAGHAGDRRSPRTSAARRTSATSTRRPSTWRRSRPTRTRSSCRRPARCSSGCADVGGGTGPSTRGPRA